MAIALTSEQVNQIVSNTTLVLLVRPDLLTDWRNNLVDLLRQVRESNLHEEAIFVSAVLALLNAPDDTLPTGTPYDSAWQAILNGLHNGVPHRAGPPGESMTLDRLLESVADAVITVMTEIPDQIGAVVEELGTMRAAAVEADVPDLIRWIDDVLALLNGTLAEGQGDDHEGVYGAFWRLIARSIESNRRGGEDKED